MPEQFNGARLKALTDLPLIGRSREIAKLQKLAASGTPALIVGPPGAGKTRMLLELRKALISQGHKVLDIRFEQPPHAFLEQIARQLAIDCENSSSIVLRGVLWKTLEMKPHVLLIDDLLEVTAPYYRFLERILAAKGNTVIGSGVDAYAVGALRRLFWNHESVVSLPTLKKRDAAALIEHAISTFLPKAGLPEQSMPSDFALRLAQAARGNPGRIVEMCIRSADSAYRAPDQHLRFGAVVMDAITGQMP
jgi:hypothetical protein